MTSIKSILDTLGSDNSRLFKEKVMAENADNELFKRVCYMTFNPYANYYIRKIPQYSQSDMYSVNFEDVLDFLNRLSERQYTGNEAISKLTTMLCGLSADDAYVIECILQSDLKVGVSVATVNKTWKGLIPSYPVMLCAADNPDTRDNIGFPALAQIKADGGRTNALVYENRVVYFSRNGKPLDLNNKVLDNELMGIRNWLGYDIMVDGEVVFWEGDVPMNRQKSNGLFNKANKHTISDEERSKAVFHVWDMVSLEEFHAGKGTQSYNDRFMTLLDNTAETTRVRSIEYKFINSWAEAKVYYAEAIARNLEGLVIKNLDGIWENKRSGDCVKMKETISGDFLCIGTTPHSKKPHLIGSLQCRSGGDNPVIFSVGSGLTKVDSMKKPEDYINKVVECEYNQITVKDDGSRSLFLPRFITIRFDKDEADTL